jgi:phosphopantothenoylcysteine synthetase/decarboxylase
MAEPTREDAQLMLQIAQWGTSLGVIDAMNQVLSDDFDPYDAEPNDPPIQKILTFGETVGTLVKRDLISKELVEDWLWIDGLWARVGPAAIKQREKMEEERLYANFEAMTSDDAPDVKAALKEAEEKRAEEERKQKEEEERKKKEEEEKKAKEEEEDDDDKDDDDDDDDDDD